jgi:peptidoglycan LD-endopeptidase LytH
MLARRRTRMLATFLAAATAVAIGPPLGASADQLEQIRERRVALEREIASVAAELDDLRAMIDATIDEIDGLQKRAQQLEHEAAEAQAAIQQRARLSFMRGGEALPFASLLSANGPHTALERAGLVAALSRRDIASLESAVALKIRIEQNNALLGARKQELAAYEQELEVRGDSLQQTFRVVSAQYHELRTRRERQRIISRGVQQGTYACIFQGAYHFRDTWGHPRSGGRRHRGTDVMAPFRAQVYAFTHGRISRMSRSRLGGIGLYIRGDDGHQYFYAHLDGYAAGMHVGRRVEAGELIAYNGYTGNASRSAPHVHFEVHPGGGGAVNPYPWLRAACYGS